MSTRFQTRCDRLAAILSASRARVHIRAVPHGDEAAADAEVAKMLKDGAEPRDMFVLVQRYGDRDADAA